MSNVTLMKENRKLVDYALMAGFFEGEGCISTSTNKRKSSVGSVRASVIQCSKNGKPHKFLTLYKKYFGGYVRKSEFRGPGNHKYLRYTYIANGAPADNLLRELLPFFEEKKERAKLAIKMGNIKLNKNGKDLRRPKKLRLAEEIRRLNH